MGGFLQQLRRYRRDTELVDGWLSQGSRSCQSGMQREGHTAVESVPKTVIAVTEHKIQAEEARAGVGE